MALAPPQGWQSSACILERLLAGTSTLNAHHYHLVAPRITDHPVQILALHAAAALQTPATSPSIRTSRSTPTGSLDRMPTMASRPRLPTEDRGSEGAFSAIAPCHHLTRALSSRSPPEPRATRTSPHARTHPPVPPRPLRAQKRATHPNLVTRLFARRSLLRLTPAGTSAAAAVAYSLPERMVSSPSPPSHSLEGTPSFPQKYPPGFSKASPRPPRNIPRFFQNTPFLAPEPRFFPKSTP